MGRPKPFAYDGENLAEIAFPLGGIGTGCVSLEGRGSLRDWEIYGRPNKGSLLQHTFPVLWWKEGDEARALVLQAPRQKGFQGDIAGFWDYGHGHFFRQGDGLPCFDSCVFTGTFPTARIRFEKRGIPLEVELTGWSPFVPLRLRESGMPVAVLNYRIRNRGKRPVDACLVWSLFNPIGEGAPGPNQQNPERANASFRDADGLRGLLFANDRFPPGDLAHGTFLLGTDWRDVTYTERWQDTGWFDGIQNFWRRLLETGELEPGARKDPGNRVAGSLGLRASLAPGEEAELPFYFAWSFPTTSKYWGGGQEKWTPYYATQWPDAWSAAQEFVSRKEELWSQTDAFSRALHETTLPHAVVESLSCTLSTFRTPTCLRLQDGTFWAWEGCSPKDGCCHGTCSHVWNYATAHAWLFPEIARSIRETEYAYGFNCGPEGQKGAINFRIPIPLKEETRLWHAASDGQLGGIMQLYRDWRITGDEAALRNLWPGAKRALEYAWIMWDRNQDGFVEGDMHNTYDINFQGPNPLTQFMYLGALQAASRIARHLGESESADHYEWLFAQGKKRAEAELWNGEYFVQTADCLKDDAPKYQHGVGCLSDQLFGQLCAKVAGLGDVVDPKKAHSALRSVFANNFKDPLGDHQNLQRVYVFRDETGLLLCSWPKGGRPKFPFVYSDEVWTGIEYQVAAHLAFEGMAGEAVRIAEAIRKRYDGRRRNPYNEYECGSHYTRALSSWSLFLAYTGLRHDAVEGTRELHPAVEARGEFRTFYCAGNEWGTATRANGKTTWAPAFRASQS
jgi:non-lysosomal glucosylceramidase